MTGHFFLCANLVSFYWMFLLACTKIGPKNHLEQHDMTHYTSFFQWYVA